MTPAGQILGGTRKETYWYRTLPLSRNVQLGSSIKTLINRFFKNKTFFKKVRREGGSVEFFVGWFIEKNSGDTIDQEVLKGLADLQIDLALDIYSPERTTRKRSR